MNDATLPGLIVPIEARIDKLEKGLNRANRLQRRASQRMEQRASQSAKRIQDAYGKMGGGIAAGFKKLALPLIGAAGLGGVARAAITAAKGVAQLGDEAKRAGVPLKDFQEWKFVAEQNRVAVDSLIDGLKELNIRGDEFVITGKGPGAEAFARLGYGAEELSKKLKDPSELLLEIMGRMRRLNTSARIRVADELFGGTAGERFVELVDQGEDGLRRTVDRAHDLGLVLGDDVVARADEVSRKFDALTARVGNFGKRVAVSIADGVTEIADLRAKLGEIFDSEDQGRSILGDEIYDELNKSRDAVEDHKGSVRSLHETYAELFREVNNATGPDGLRIFEIDNEDAKFALADIMSEMRNMVDQLDAGKISAEEFEEGMEGIVADAQDVSRELAEIDAQGFSGVISGIDSIVEALTRAIGLATSLKSALPGGSELSPMMAFRKADAESMRAYEADKAAQDSFLAGEAKRNAMSKDRLKLEREITSVQKRAATDGVTLSRAQAEAAAKAKIAADQVRTDAGRSGSGGSRGKTSDYAREADSIAAETAALKIEADELSSLTGKWAAHTNAIELAKTKTDLLAAAMRSGLSDTPSLRAQIDGMAERYVEAASAAELAADKIQEVQDAGRAGAQSVADVFTGMASGALSAKEAVGQLIVQILKLSFQKRMLEMAENSTGWLATIFKVIGGGFADGGYTGDGGKYETAGIVHKGEYVMPQKVVQRVGVDRLAGLHRAALRGYSDGGLVGGRAPLRAAPRATSGGLGAVAQQITVNAPVTVNGSAGTPSENSDLARAMAREMEGTFRGLIGDELRRQMRPGNMMNRRS